MANFFGMRQNVIDTSKQALQLRLLWSAPSPVYAAFCVLVQKYWDNWLTHKIYCVYWIHKDPITYCIDIKPQRSG